MPWNEGCSSLCLASLNKAKQSSFFYMQYVHFYIVIKVILFPINLRSDHWAEIGGPANQCENIPRPMFGSSWGHHALQLFCIRQSINSSHVIQST